ncbi:hypothetical protein HY772_08680 [Candidatus Woesearchaeota archaeon]|nr:hypothetical protein [Candidatus Woesearchaeota archaeon]
MGSRAEDSNDRLIYNINTGTLLSDIDGVGDKGASVLATFAPGTRINSASFTVI